jgi:hypothetical protein
MKSKKTARSHASLSHFVFSLGLIFLASWLVYEFLLPKFLLKNQFPERIFINFADDSYKIAQNTLVIAVDRSSTKSQIVSQIAWLDGSQKIELAGGYGNYELRSVYPLLKLDKKDDFFIRGQLSLSLKTIFTKVISVSISPQELPSDMAIQNLSDQQKTLSKLFLKRALVALPNYHRFAELMRIHYLVKAIDSQVDSLDELVKNSNLVDNNLANSCSVAILNETGVNGLATLYATLLEQDGGRVVRVDSGSSPTSDDSNSVQLSSTTIRVVPEQKIACEKVAKTIQAMLPRETKIEVVGDSNLLTDYRAQLVVTLEK